MIASIDGVIMLAYVLICSLLSANFCIIGLTFSMLDTISDLKLKDPTLVGEYDTYNRLLQKMAENKCHGCIKLQDHMTLLKELNEHKEEVNKLKYQMSDEALQQMPYFQGRVCLLLVPSSCDSHDPSSVKRKIRKQRNRKSEINNLRLKDM